MSKKRTLARVVVACSITGGVFVPIFWICLDAYARKHHSLLPEDILVYTWPSAFLTMGGINQQPWWDWVLLLVLSGIVNAIIYGGAGFLVGSVVRTVAGSFFSGSANVNGASVDRSD